MIVYTAIRLDLVWAFTLWKRVTNDSIFKIFYLEVGQNITRTTNSLKPKNHYKNLVVDC